MKLVEHKVRSVDTIQSLAYLYLNDASRWREIVDFNNLDYPYTTDMDTFPRLVKASGTITVTRDYPTSIVPIPSGTVFSTPPVDGAPAKTYVSTKTVTFNAGYTSVVIPVACTIAGIWGNTYANTITQLYNATPLVTATVSSVSNALAFTNGNTLNVRLIGDSILIPVADSWAGTQTYNDLDTFYRTAFGTDIALGDDGDLIFDGYGALGSVVGVDNFAQAVRDRLLTPKLSLTYHPDYGSYLDRIPSQGLVRGFVLKLIGLAIIETIMADDRASKVSVTSLRQIGLQVDAVVDVIPVNQGDAIRIPVSIPNVALLRAG